MIYICIDDLINDLMTFKNQYGNLPIVISANGSDEDFLKPLKVVFGINMVEQITEDNQAAVVLSNYIITDSEETDTEIEIEI